MSWSGGPLLVGFQFQKSLGGSLGPAGSLVGNKANLRREEEGKRANLRQEEEGKRTNLRREEEKKRPNLRGEEGGKRANLRGGEEGKRANLMGEEEGKRAFARRAGTFLLPNTYSDRFARRFFFSPYFALNALRSLVPGYLAADSLSPLRWFRLRTKNKEKLLGAGYLIM